MKAPKIIISGNFAHQYRMFGGLRLIVETDYGYWVKADNDMESQLREKLRQGEGRLMPWKFSGGSRFPQAVTPGDFKHLDW